MGNQSRVNMSWDAYATGLIGTGKVKGAALFGGNGSIWCQSGISLGQEEIKAIDAGFKSMSMPNGIHVGGTKYMFLRCDGDMMLGKKGAEGVSICKTLTGYVLGTYGEDVQAGQNTNEVFKIAEYLKGLNM